MIVYDFNRYLLSDEQIAAFLDDGGALIISPVQEPPEETENFMLYEFERRMDADLWLVQNMTLTYEIWSFSYDAAIQIDERMNRLAASDTSGARFYSWRNRPDVVAEFFDGERACYRVQNLSHMFSGDLPPPDEQGGKFGRIVVLELTYTPFDIEPDAP